MGHPVDGEFLALEPLKQPSGKLVLAWAVCCDFDPSTLASNTFSMEWPSKSGRQAQFPEVDRAAWFPIEAARRKILKGQAPFLDQLLDKVPAMRHERTPAARAAKPRRAVSGRCSTTNLCHRWTGVHPSESSAGREQRFVFDEVAELYARVRPTYPAALVDDVIRESGLQPGGRILELGSGPGNASVLFSGRGYHLLSVEPGARLADVARRRLAADSNARVEVTTFEAWPVEPDAFDLVYAAQSFHWMDPAVRFSKTARALKPNGTLAIFANRPLHGTSRVDGQIREAYAAHAPAIDARWIGHNTRDHFLELFAAASEFRAAQWREYAWRRRVQQRRVSGPPADAFGPSAAAGEPTVDPARRDRRGHRRQRRPLQRRLRRGPVLGAPGAGLRSGWCVAGRSKTPTATGDTTRARRAWSGTAAR